MPVSSYQFGQFETDLRSYEPKQDGLQVRLEKIPMELLIFLTEHHGELISREQIIEDSGERTFSSTPSTASTPRSGRFVKPCGMILRIRNWRLWLGRATVLKVMSQ